MLFRSGMGSRSGGEIFRTPQSDLFHKPSIVLHSLRHSHIFVSLFCFFIEVIIPPLTALVVVAPETDSDHGHLPVRRYRASFVHCYSPPFIDIDKFYTILSPKVGNLALVSPTFLIVLLSMS